MTFHLYNSLTKKKEVFESLEPGKVRMYNCGPTVYSRAHIGNLRSFLFADILRRWLEHLGYQVLQVMNITDVGHLTDDEADEGEDKIEAQARREQKDPWQISAEYARVFLEDLQALGVRPAMAYPRATEHIDDMVAMIEGLLEKGVAYRVGDEVYYDVHRFPEYGKLSGNRIEDLEAGARVEVDEKKRHPADFLLWKSDPHHLMKWKTRFGPHGFPGWHIECSAMAMRLLGEQIDIHTGGEDNVFPHHECEIAQSEALTGKPFARFWAHAKFLQVDGGKMSKRLGNVYTLADVREHGYTPRELRYTLIRGHYRQPLNFTWQIMGESRRQLEKLEDLVQRLRRIRDGREGADDAAAGLEGVANARAEFEAAMNDDLNVPRALATLFVLRDEAVAGRLGGRAAEQGLAFLETAHDVLGVLDLSEQELEEEVEDLIRRREQARADKDWAEADRIRDELGRRGIVLEDTPAGTTWRRG